MARIDQLERTYQQQVSAGAQPNSLALMFLRKARGDTSRARTAESGREVERYLDDWERRFLRQ